MKPRLALLVREFATLIEALPTECGGTIARILLALILLALRSKIAAAVPPTVTRAEAEKFVPSMSTIVPPFTGPLFGDTLLILGRIFAVVSCASTAVKSRSMKQGSNKTNGRKRQEKNFFTAFMDYNSKNRIVAKDRIPADDRYSIIITKNC